MSWTPFCFCFPDTIFPTLRYYVPTTIVFCLASGSKDWSLPTFDQHLNTLCQINPYPSWAFPLKYSSKWQESNTEAVKGRKESTDKNLWIWCRNMFICLHHYPSRIMTMPSLEVVVVVVGDAPLITSTFRCPQWILLNPLTHLLISSSSRTCWWKDIHSNCGGFEPLGWIWIPHCCSQCDWHWGTQQALRETEDWRGSWVSPKI